MAVRWFATAFERVDDTVWIRLGDEERDLLEDLAGQFRSVVEADSDPDLRRLYPIAYPADDDKEAEYTSLVHEDLVRSRLAAVETVEATVRGDSVDDDELAGWMGVLNGIRLLLGTRLDVSEDDEFDPEAPDAPTRALLAWLGLLLEEAVEAASGSLDRNAPA